ncbi:methyltransferase domain-containing protein [Candidatus Raskinella chloraquaticus]|uniref:methyltransferase domain-containing protein n=1 Tax=Candidatus Raskinella chloraquaticus TaxID=1951219 RepID=UPI00269B8E4D
MSDAAIHIGEQHWGTQTDFRARRLVRFVKIVDEVIARKGHCRIVDLGGNIEYWRDLEAVWSGRSVSFVLINLMSQRLDDQRFESRVGDCTNMAEFADNSFDVVHSNSVLEHVGRWQAMRAMAREVRRLAPRYFVQTPDFWFPLEPHFRVPFFHWLPEPVRLALVMRFDCGAFPRAATLDDAQRYIEDSILIDRKRMSALFPDASISSERVFGLSKSLIAIR